MAHGVTELALLRIDPSTNITSPALLESVRQTKYNLEKISPNSTFEFYSCVEDASLIYTLGCWPSISAHLNFRASPEFNVLMNPLAGQLEVEWMFHTSHPPESLVHVRSADIFTITRYFVVSGQKAEFETEFDRGKGELESFIGGSDLVVPGWRLDKEGDDQEEMVLFTGWPSKARHLEFAKTEGFKQYAKINDHLSGVDTKHMVKLQL